MPASGCSLVQRSPTECGVSECDREASIMRRPFPTRGCCVMGCIYVCIYSDHSHLMQKVRIAERSSWYGAEVNVVSVLCLPLLRCTCIVELGDTHHSLPWLRAIHVSNWPLCVLSSVFRNTMEFSTAQVHIYLIKTMVLSCVVHFPYLSKRVECIFEHFKFSHLYVVARDQFSPLMKGTNSITWSFLICNANQNNRTMSEGRRVLMGT